MKTCIKKLLLLHALTIGVGLILAGRATAQTFTTLYSFTAFSTYGVHSDGAYPCGGLILSGNTQYWRGSWGRGTMFNLSLGQLTIIRSGANVWEKSSAWKEWTQ